MAVPGLFWIELGLGVVLLFLSAKAHGRQIRLERELEGHFEVDFMGENNPWVEALWRTDRRQYWATFPVALGLLVGYAIISSVNGLPPGYGTEPFGAPLAGSVLLAVILWTPVVAFVGNGLTSAMRLHRRLREPHPSGTRRDAERIARGPWLRSTIRGTYAYWGLIAVVAAVAIALAVA